MTRVLLAKFATHGSAKHIVTWPKVVSYSSGITAAEKDAHWTLALALLQESMDQQLGSSGGISCHTFEQNMCAGVVAAST